MKNEMMILLFLSVVCIVLPFLLKNKEGAVKGINVGTAVDISKDLVKEASLAKKDAENMYNGASKGGVSTSALMDIHKKVTNKGDLIRNNEKKIGNYQLNFNKSKEVIRQGTIKYPALNNLYKEILVLKYSIEETESKTLELSQTSAKKSEDTEIPIKQRVEIEKNKKNDELIRKEEIKKILSKPDNQFKKEEIQKILSKSENDSQPEIDNSTTSSPTSETSRSSGPSAPTSGPSSYCTSDPLISNSLAEIIENEKIIIKMLNDKE